MLEKTCYARAWDAKRLRQYMLTYTTLLISKMDPIKYIFEKLAQTGRVARWQMDLIEYDIQHVTQKYIKGSVLSDYLAHQPLEDYQSMHFKFPDEDIMLITNYNIPGPRKDPSRDPDGPWYLMELLTFMEMSLGHLSPPRLVFTSPSP